MLLLAVFCLGMLMFFELGILWMLLHKMFGATTSCNYV